MGHPRPEGELRPLSEAEHLALEAAAAMERAGRKVRRLSRRKEEAATYCLRRCVEWKHGA